MVLIMCCVTLKFDLAQFQFQFIYYYFSFFFFFLGLTLRNWDIYSLRQPDAIKFFKHNDEEYLITANEGEGLEYAAGSKSWREFERGEYFFES